MRQIRCGEEWLYKATFYILANLLKRYFIYVKIKVLFVHMQSKSAGNISWLFVNDKFDNTHTFIIYYFFCLFSLAGKI